MKAVVKINKNQYIVAVDEEVVVDRIKEKEGKKVKFEEVLAILDEKKNKIGTPLVKGAIVEAEVVEHFKGEKLRVATYRAKSRYRKVKGHRSLYTKLKILKIGEK
jgi:large subunit ribosomal protein L21